MNYNKPAVDVLGEAVQLIQGQKPCGIADGQFDVGWHLLVDSVPPVYELDE